MKRNENTPINVNRRRFIKQAGLMGGALAVLPALLKPNLARTIGKIQPVKRVPAILVTDFAGDIDDTWALGFLLKSPELDLKLIATEYGCAPYRSKVLAKFLETTGHGHIPIAIGPDVEPREEGKLAPWVKDYDIKKYPGQVYTDGIQAIIDTVMQSKERITIIAVGPADNLSAALKQQPAIAEHARLVGMFGSIRLGYNGEAPPSAEWNVKGSTKAAQAILSAPWDITITPLDTCGAVVITGQRYAKLLKGTNPVVRTVLDNFRLWASSQNGKYKTEKQSSQLCDIVAIYLAFSQDLCRMERLGIRVTDDGFTVIDEHAKQMNAATSWKSLDGFCDLLVDRLLS